MCDFSHPWLLLLLPAAPLLGWWWLRRPRAALRFPETRSLAQLPAGRRTVARVAGVALRVAGLLLLITALAGPRWPDPRTRIAAEGIAIQMVVDVSGSMAEPDYTWQGKPTTRLEAVKRVFHLFVAGGEAPDGQVLEGRPDDAIGLIAFAAWPETVCPLTHSHDTLLRLLDEQRPRTLPTESQTNIGDALAWGLLRLENAPTPRKIVVLLTDGEHNVPPPALTPRQAAQLAGNERVPIYAIDAGGETAGTNEMAEGMEAKSAAEIRASARRSLQAIAQVSGGKYFRAQDTDTLVTVCQEIDRLERRPLATFLYRRYYEAYAWVGLAALACFAGIHFLERTLWLTVP
jgi:Ca-activated chloride channel family protein